MERNTDTAHLAKKQLRKVYKTAVSKFQNEELDDEERCKWALVLTALAGGTFNVSFSE